MWINCSIALPPEAGKYQTLIEVDEWGTLQRSSEDVFDGKDWSHIESNRQFISYWYATADQYKVITQKLEQQRDKSQEDEKLNDEADQIHAFIKANHPHHNIIDLYKEYIILACDAKDLSNKRARIDRGDTLGSYIQQRILDIVKENRSKFITKWFSECEIAVYDHNNKQVTISIPYPHIQQRIAMAEFDIDFKQSGFAKYSIEYGYREGFSHRSPTKQRDFNDTITFSIK